MFRRLLICWLVISLQGYGLALAADLHGRSHAQGVACAAAPDHDDGAHATDGDHCNHGAFHLLGLPAVPFETTVVRPAPIRVTYSPRLPLVFLPRRLRPPTLRFC